MDTINETVDVVLSGDPKRKVFFQKIMSLYYLYNFFNRVFLFFERNPAVSFNRAARESNADILFCTADLYVPLCVIQDMIQSHQSKEVTFLVDTNLKGKSGIQFRSGVFIVERKDILKNPIPEYPDFLEEILWQQSAKNFLKFKPFFGYSLHLHKHAFKNIYRLNRLRTKARAILKGRGVIRRSLYALIDFEDSARIYFHERFMENPDITLQRLLEKGALVKELKPL
jgi:hypothetical protein